MKKTFLTLLAIFCMYVTCMGQGTDLIFVVEQSTNKVSFYAKTESSFEVDWENNGQWEEISTTGLEKITRTLTSAPDTIRIKGELNHFKAPKTITDVVQWGSVGFTSLSETFKDCHQLVSFSAQDAPDLSGVEDMNLAFAHTEKFNGDISNWDVSNVTNMAHMFHDAKSFNQDLNNWDVSSVQYMYNMFDRAESFNQSLADWDVSSVKSMYNIFINTALTQPNFDRMVKNWSELDGLQPGVSFGFNSHFCSAGEALSKLEDTHGWVLPEDRVQSCEEEFVIVVDQRTSPITFNANTQSSFLVDWENDGSWVEYTTNGMETISHEFTGSLDTIRIKGELNHFHAPKRITDVVKWGDVYFTSLENTFQQCYYLKSFSATDVPNLSEVSSIAYMFSGARSFNGDVSLWDVSNVESMRSTFHRAELFNQDLSTWDVSNVINVRYMFNDAISFNGDLGSWDVSSVTRMDNMFNGATSFEGNVSSWNVSNVEKMDNMFTESGITSANYDLLLKAWSTLPNLQSDVQLDVSAKHCTALEEKTYLEENYGWVITDDGACDELLRHLELVLVVDGTDREVTITQFKGEVDIDWENNGNWEHVSNTTYKNITHDYDGNEADTIRIRGQVSYFRAPKSIVDVAQWGKSKFEDFQKTFQSCEKLEGFSAKDFPDLSLLTNEYFGLNEMFDGAISFNGDLSKWDVSKVKNMSYMFEGATSFNGDLSSWDVSSVTRMDYMFKEATSFNGNLSTWNVSSVTRMDNMFNGAISFEGDISSWNISSVTMMENMFTESGITSANYDKLLKSWSALPELKRNVQLDVSTYYCQSFAERQKLIDDHGWTINDKGSCEFIFVVDGSEKNISFPVTTASSFDIDWENDGNWETISAVDSIEISHNYSNAPDTIIIRGELNHFRAPKTIIDVVQWGDPNFNSFYRTFEECTALVSFSAQIPPNLTNVTTFERAFYNAYYFNGDVSEWDVSSVKNMNYMFYTTDFNGDLRDWDVSSVETMVGMFFGSWKFIGGGIGNWDVSSVTKMTVMFSYCADFEEDISDWNIIKVTDMDGFIDLEYKQEYYDNILMKWSELDVQRNVKINIDADYCLGEEGREKLRNDYGWDIYDGAKKCSEVSNARTTNLTNSLEESVLNIDELHGNLDWKLYDFTGQLIDSGSLTLQVGEQLKWWELQKEYKKAGILRITDDSGKVAVKKFIKQ
ncbi:BspA family leucine-rich repeat surface protein [Flammeovirga aprica]|uniref:DUF285 domain-containing protein n=1 Tax=Flammeovirga aprica JL-4 TaxID=694437 RepID=A0A7X9RW61_9BACT|nr:BspA family leucine-rich repeat surface protein [Flammeovirga aprica]NME69785.1 DUF285 domain-containing protein [Flammeovirga aprica JL-4]